MNGKIYIEELKKVKYKDKEYWHKEIEKYDVSQKRRNKKYYQNEIPFDSEHLENHLYKYSENKHKKNTDNTNLDF